MYYTDDDEMLFYDKFYVYKITKGETLKNVAEKLNMHPKELRRYHNMFCLDADLIEADFKSYSKFLILAPEKNILTENEIVEKMPEKVSFGNDYKLPFSPDKNVKHYSVKYISEVGDDVDVTEMTIDVKWLATDKNKYHLFEINRGTDIYINGKVLDTTAEELAAKTAEVLYPLKVVVNEYGKWLDIYNYNEIDSRWGKVKRDIFDYYEGEVVEAYIDEIESSLKNSDALLESLRSDYFLRSFFNGIHVGYSAEYSFKNEISFPLEKEEEAIFEIQQKITPFFTNAGFIEVEQKGNYLDSGLGILYGYTFSKVNYSAFYSLNSKSYAIEKLNIECNIDCREPIKKTIAIEFLIKETGKNN